MRWADSICASAARIERFVASAVFTHFHSVTGPETFNFSDVVAAFDQTGALQRVHDAGELASKVTELFSDAPRRTRLGAASSRVVAENTGATRRLLELLRAEIHACSQ